MKVNIGKYKKNENPRTIKIEIDDWDIWNLDHTLAMVIHPALVKFRENLNSHPSEVTGEEWEEILDKMIFSFDVISNELFIEQQFFRDGTWHKEEYEEHNKKIQEGIDLFAKWFRGLWN